jgi:hypothetical protein
MAHELTTDIEIRAPATRVWAVLTDFARYPDWNPFILAVHGAVLPQAVIRYRFRFLQLRVWANAEVLELQAERELRWAASFLTPSIFRGEHYFLIRPVSETDTVFRHGEIFSGLTLPLVWPVLQKYGPAIYQSLNRALKQRAEASLGNLQTS